MRKGNVFYFIATGTFTLICSRVGNMRILFCMRPSCLSSLSTPFPSVGIGSLHFPRNGAVFVVFSVVLCTALPNNCNIVLRFVELLRSRENLFAVRKRSLLSRQLFCLPLRYFRLTCLFISFPETHGILYLPLLRRGHAALGAPCYLLFFLAVTFLPLARLPARVFSPPRAVTFVPL